MNTNQYASTHEYIVRRFKDGVLVNKEGEYALPYSFVPPCIDGLFKCLFYWDTFYTNKGLILDGYADLAKNNVNNLLYLLDKYGFVPNSNSYPGIKHNSQPPYLHFMVSDIYECFKDEEWLKKAYYSLKKEYEFWMNERITPVGLNRYLHHKKTDDEKIEFYDYVATRLNIDKNASRDIKIKWGSSFNAAAEGGLDFSPRYNIHGDEICPIDLNSILYAMEGNMAKWARMFEPSLEKYYLSAQVRRLELINKYCFNKDLNCYFDFNFVKGEFEQTNIYFTGQFFPYIVGINNDKDSCLNVLRKVEFEFGIASTNEFDNTFGYQAAYPYSWPYDNGITFWALKTLNMSEDIKRVGDKYLHLCDSSFKKSGHLWETYNATIDEIAIKKEYPNKEMMGWTAGIFEWIYDYLYL